MFVIMDTEKKHWIFSTPMANELKTWYGTHPSCYTCIELSSVCGNQTSSRTHCKFGNFQGTFISRIFYFQTISEFVSMYSIKLIVTLY